jgi:hypothetical protein
MEKTMGIFNVEIKSTPDARVQEVRTMMSEQLGFNLTKEQAVERLCNLYLAEAKK